MYSRSPVPGQQIAAGLRMTGATLGVDANEQFRQVGLAGHSTNPSPPLRNVPGHAVTELPATPRQPVKAQRRVCSGLSQPFSGPATRSDLLLRLS